MFDITLIQMIPQLPWQAKEVIRELDYRPHVLVRIQITGGYFQHRAAEPFVRIVSRGKVVESWFAEVSDDNTTLSGYFQTDIAAGGIIEYGYGSKVEGRLEKRFTIRNVEKLNRKNLPKEAVIVTDKFLKEKRR